MTNADDWVHQMAMGYVKNPPLTKREYFAAMAMHGYSANTETWKEFSIEDVAAKSVMIADALINELNKQA